MLSCRLAHTHRPFRQPPPHAQTDLTHINILAELYCDAGQWRDALAAVQHAEAALLGPGEELPVDLRVRGGSRIEGAKTGCLSEEAGRLGPR